ncbi:unnamed protein product [Trichobilharzia regenti]|nr:unnamed protein product [Trichobilharzia regenti]
MNKACLSNRYKQKIIKQALNANFILLYQPAPNSFIIIQKSDHHIPGDHEITENEEPTTTSSLINRCSCNLHDKHNCRPHRREPPPPPQQQQQQLQGVVLRQRYRVVIGPQICNCQNEFMPESGLMTTTTTMMMTKEPCIHLLFAEFWIENYRNYRQSIRQSYTKNKKYSSTSLSTSLSSNTAKSNANSPELSKFSEKLLLLNNTTSNNEAVSNTRLIIPQPIRHEQSQHHQQQQQQQANNNLSHLRAIIHPNTFDSTELSSITQDIIPVSRREVESSTGSGGSGLGSTCCDPSTTSYNTTVTSRTSSIDSIESYKLDSSNSRVNDFHHPLPPPHHHHQYHHRPHLPHHHHPHQHDHRQHQNYQMKTATSINSDRSLSCRRPRTAPQPELPPRLGLAAETISLTYCGVLLVYPDVKCQIGRDAHPRGFQHAVSHRLPIIYTSAVMNKAR